jgi:hypothetical protein
MEGEEGVDRSDGCLVHEAKQMRRQIPMRLIAMPLH